MADERFPAGGELVLHPRPCLRQALRHLARRPLLAVDGAAECVLELPVAHRLRFADEKRQLRRQLRTMLGEEAERRDEVVEVDE